MLPLLAFISGVALASQLSFSMLVLALWMLLAISAFAMTVYLLKTFPSVITVLKSFVILSSSLGLGLLGWLLAYQHVTRWQLPDSLVMPVNVSLNAMVVGLPTEANHGTSVTVAVSSSARKALPGNNRQFFSHEPIYLRLQVYQNTMPMLAGQYWHLSLRLKPLHGSHNPGGFDYVRWLQQQDIQATGSILAAKFIKRSYPHTLTIAIARLRAKLREAQIHTLAPTPLVGILTALCLGDKSLVSPKVQQVFIYTGTAHLLAISGLHVGLIAGLICLLGQRVWRLWPRLCLILPAKTAGYMLGVIGAWAYALLAGFAVSTERAALMVTFAAWAYASQCRLSWLRVWTLTLFVVLLLRPLSVTSSGLWLSFSAVLALTYLASQSQQYRLPVYRWLSLQLRLTLLLAPLMLALFHRVSLSTIPANLIAIPWIGSVIVPLSLVATLMLLWWPWLGHVLLTLSLYLLKLIWPLLTWLAYLPHITLSSGVGSLIALLISLLAMAWLLAPMALPWRGLSLGLMLPAWLNPSVPVPMGALRMSVLDVGQGLSAVVQTAHHTLVYDTGPGMLTGFNAGNEVLVPFLYDAGIRRIDKVILSHGDNDHIAGFLALEQSFGQIPVLTSAPLRIRKTLILSANYPMTLCIAGMHWQWDEVDFRILYPSRNDFGLNNNSSCVLQIEASGRRLLLPGDIEAPAELRLYRHMPKALASDVLVVPHHGSAGAALPTFIMTIAPKYAIFSTGYMNRFHFPRAKVLASYQHMQSLLFNTAVDGAITVSIASPSPKLNQPGKLTITTDRNT